MTEDNRNQEVDETEAHLEAEHDSSHRTGLRDYFSKLLLMIGLSLTGLFIAFWIQSVLYERRVGDLQFKAGKVFFYLGVLASAESGRYLYVIVGIILCLPAIHLIRRRD